MASLLLTLGASILLIGPVLATETATTPAPTPAAASAPGGAPASGSTKADAASGADTQVVFGIISLSADHKALTLTDGKGTVTTLKVTRKTEATIDLHDVDLTAISTTQTVRVTFTGEAVDSVDQLSAGKKKKKKNP